jgi:hypothetical protein
MDRVLAIEGVEDLKGKTVFKGLFGEDLVIVDDAEEEKLTVPVMTKLTKRENEALEGWAYKFGMSKAKFIRHCLRQQMKDLTMLTEP